MNLTDAQKIMAEVAAAHRLHYNDCAVKDADFYTCECGMKTPLGDGVHAEWWDKHLAVEIDKALGGLRREVSKGTRQCSYPGSGGPCEGHAHTRFVTEWEPIR